MQIHWDQRTSASLYIHLWFICTSYIYFTLLQNGIKGRLRNKTQMSSFKTMGGTVRWVCTGLVPQRRASSGTAQLWSCLRTSSSPLLLTFRHAILFVLGCPRMYYGQPCCRGDSPISTTAAVATCKVTTDVYFQGSLGGGVMGWVPILLAGLFQWLASKPEGLRTCTGVFRAQKQQTGLCGSHHV